MKAGALGYRRLCWGGVVTAGALCSCEPSAPTPHEPIQWTLEHDLEIGSLDGRDGAPTFGHVSDIVGTSDGGVVVVDVQGPRVSRYSAEGRFLHQLGGVGGGPGEYRDISGAVLMSDGTVLVRDPRRALVFFSPGGAVVDEWPLRVDYVGADPVAVVGDTVLLKLIRSRMGIEDFWKTPVYGFARVIDGHVIDTVTPVPGYGQTGLYWAPYYPTYHIAWLADGSVVHGAGSEYHIVVVGSQGDTLAILHKVTEPIQVPASVVERISEHRQWLESRANRSEPFYPPELSVLPVIDGLLISSRDEVWISRPVGAIGERLTHRIDVWDRNGRELGWLDVPPRTEIRSVVGDWVWGVRRGDYDEQYVVRYRLVREPGQSS